MNVQILSAVTTLLTANRRLETLTKGGYPHRTKSRDRTRKTTVETPTKRAHQETEGRRL